MIEELTRVMDAAAYQYFAHKYCLSLNAWLVWTEAATSFLTFVAYMAMPWIFMLKTVRTRVPYWYLFVLFVGFCGLGHLVDLLSLTSPRYYHLAAVVDIGTVLASVVAAFGVWQLLKFWQARDRQAHV